MDKFIFNPKAKEYLKQIRDAGFCGDGSFEDEIHGIEKYNDALKAKFAFEKMTEMIQDLKSEQEKRNWYEYLENSQHELNIHYNVLTDSQRVFVDKTFKGNIYHGNTLDGERGNFYRELASNRDSCLGEQRNVQSSYAQVNYVFQRRYNLPRANIGLSIITPGDLVNNIEDKRLKELEKKTKKLIENNKEIWDEMNLQDKRLKELEEENVGLIQNNDKNIELLISYKELMNIQNKRIDELEKKLSQSILTSSIMFASGIIIGVVGSWRLLSK